TLHGLDGNDQLFGGEGNDTLTVNGRGSNTLDGDSGDDTLKINRSTDYYYNRDVARNATNTLTGGVGNDRLEGSVGAETYVFNVGDGADVINDYDYNTFNKTDRIQFGEGITKDALSIRREDNHMVVLINGGSNGDSITIENAYSDGRYRIEEIVLTDGTTFTPQSLPLYASDGDDVIQGSGFNEQITAGAGNDIVYADGGEDVVDGGVGADELHGGDGNDQLFGGEGNDTLTVNGRGSNTLDGDSGDDTLKINRSTDYYYNRDVARNATNTLTGGVGNDRLEGSVGAETYVFNVGDGADVIN
ncbi:hypothetical protein KY881_004572, partial [Vibrio vulnificus]|nr:hypothetical protein [Vibrio vulnificus]